MLTDTEPAVTYAQEKTEALLKAGNDHHRLRTIKCQIFSEFKDIYEYDLDNAVYPEPFGTFRSQEEKEQFIRLKLMYEDFKLYIGNIFLPYHEELIRNDQIPLIDEYSLVIDYNELYDTALAEYIRVLQGIPHPVDLPRLEFNQPVYATVGYRGEEIKILTGYTKRRPHACAANLYCRP